MEHQSQSTTPPPDNTANGCAYERRFTLAQTSVPLLGGDFLIPHGLMVDFKHGRLVDPEAIMAIQSQRNSVQQPDNTFLVNNNTPYQHAVDRFCDVFCLQLKQRRGAVPKHGVYHHITTSGPKVFTGPTPLESSEDAACYNVIPGNGSHGSVY